jgi:hypothetical protein
MAKLTPGSRLRSAVCATEVMVIASPHADGNVTCGGLPMIALDAERPRDATLDAAAAGAPRSASPT